MNAIQQKNASSIGERISAYNWSNIVEELYSGGSAILKSLLTQQECEATAKLYAAENIFRSRVVMERHGFGRGEYQYFSYPLPELVGELRRELYPLLMPTANHWNQVMGIDYQYPNTLAEFTKRCHSAGQLRPTPLLLQYREGDYNCLHQDLYGEHIFP